MSVNDRYLPVLRFLREFGTATRTEAGKMLGKTRNVIAGICDKNGIAPWPKFSKEQKRSRRCQFPITDEATQKLKLCGCLPDIGHSYLCKTHRQATWPLPPKPKKKED